MSTKIITRWLKGWVSQTLRVENNNNIILDVFYNQKTRLNNSGATKKFANLQILCITKFKALFNYLSNPSVSLRVPAAWGQSLFEAWCLFEEIQYSAYLPTSSFSICWRWALSRMFFTNFSRNVFPKHLLTL